MLDEAALTFYKASQMKVLVNTEDSLQANMDALSDLINASSDEANGTISEELQKEIDQLTDKVKTSNIYLYLSPVIVTPFNSFYSLYFQIFLLCYIGY